nr:hypothetical protein [Cellulomonas sp. KH9]
MGPWDDIQRACVVRARRDPRRTTMSKRGRKRRSRKGNAANHGKRPNA